MRFSRYIWIPRILVVILIIMVAYLSVEVMDLNASLGKKLLACLVNNIPTLLLLMALLITWERPLQAGIFTLLLTAIFTIFFHTYGQWVTFLFFTILPLLAGIMFMLVYFLRPTDDKKPRQEI